MSSLSIGKAWDEAKAALLANRKLIVPVALGLILLPAVVVSMVEPRVPPGEQPPAGPWMLIALLMVIVMVIGQLAIVLLVNGWRGSVGEAIGKCAKHKQQAWQLVKFLTARADANLDYAFLKGAVPALTANLTPWRALLAKELPGVTVQIPADAVGKYGKVARLHFVAKFDDIAKVISPAIADVESNKAQAKTALDQIGLQVAQLLIG